MSYISWLPQLAIFAHWAKQLHEKEGETKAKLP